MATFGESLVQGVRDAFCEWQSNVDSFWSSIGNQVSASTGIPDFLIPNPNAGLAGRLICNNDDPTLPPPVPFMGGQCPGEDYNVNIQIDWVSNGFPQPPAFGIGVLTGPLTYVNGPVEGSNQSRIGIVDVNGDFEGLETSAPIDEGAITSSTITRVDGMPDDCGNPPVAANPTLIQNNITNNITYDNSQGMTVNENITYAFGFAYVDADVNLLVPIDVSIGSINVPVRFNLSTGDISFSFGGRGGGEGGGGGDRIILEPAPPEAPDDTGPDIPEPPDPREEESIVGALVTVTSITPPFNGTQVDGGVSSDLYLPRLAQVQFTYRFSDGATGFSEAFSITNRRQFVPSPRPENTIDATLFPAQGVTLFLSLVKERDQVNSQ